MYREPDPVTRRCPSCGSESLSEETMLDPSEGYLNLRFAVTGAAPTFLGGAPTESFRVDRARVCLGCGHLVVVMGRAALARLRSRAGALAAVREE